MCNSFRLYASMIEMIACMTRIFTLTILLISFHSNAQPNEISTQDITHFWEAYDALVDAKSKEDSIKTIEGLYLKRATKGFKKFQKVRDFQSKYYVYHIANSPGFWESVRPLTEQIANREDEIIEIMNKMSAEIPGFKAPKVCFAIGTLSTGGTTGGGYIHIGSEISASDYTVDTTNLNGWLKSIIGKTGDIVSMVAHEAVHTNQHGNVKITLLTASMGEGIADFITNEVLGKNINASIHEYGLKNECQLWKEFQTEMDSKSYSNWLYNGSSAIGRPADLGYFMGFRIAQAYYDKTEDKKQALSDLLDRSKYVEIFQKSGYSGCEEGK